MRTTPLLAALTFALAACGGSGDNTPTQPPVTYPATATVVSGASANTFTDPSVTIAKGGTVTWTFAARPHNVTFAAAAGVPENVPTTTNASASRTFGTTGTFTYQCTIHPGMTGDVIVK